MFRPILIVAALTLGLAIGLALATQTFQNSPQQIMLVTHARAEQGYRAPAYNSPTSSHLDQNSRGTGCALMLH